MVGWKIHSTMQIVRTRSKKEVLANLSTIEPEGLVARIAIGIAIGISSSDYPDFVTQAT